LRGGCGRLGRFGGGRRPRWQLLKKSKSSPGEGAVALTDAAATTSRLNLLRRFILTSLNPA